MNNKTSSVFKTEKKAILPCAEVITSSLDAFTAQCWKADYSPALGSLVSVTVDKTIIVGSVCQIATGSLDNTRYPFTYQKTEAELRAEQPQIFEFLKTTFDVIILGYTPSPLTEQSSFYYLLPTRPCSVHAFVTECDHATAARFFKNPLFLPFLWANQQKTPYLEDLLLSIVKILKEEHQLTPDVFQNFYQTYSLLTGNDYRRMKLFLQRAQHLLEEQITTL